MVPNFKVDDIVSFRLHGRLIKAKIWKIIIPVCFLIRTDTQNRDHEYIIPIRNLTLVERK